MSGIADEIHKVTLESNSGKSDRGVDLRRRLRLWTSSSRSRFPKRKFAGMMGTLQDALEGSKAILQRKVLDVESLIEQAVVDGIISHTGNWSGVPPFCTSRKMKRL